MAWLWRRKNNKDPQPEPTREDASSPVDDGVIRQEQARSGDWMTLPPMATNGPIPTTFRVQTLPEILTTHQSPRVSGSLGHAVSAQGPSGIVSGLAIGTGRVHADTAAGVDLPLRVPHANSAEEEAATVQRTLPVERSLPVAPPEPIAVSTLPEPAVSRTLGAALPLAAPVSGGRDLPVATAIDAPLPQGEPSTSIPASAAPSSSNDAISQSPAPEAPLAAPDPLVGGFDHSAFHVAADEPDRELLSPAPEDLAPPIQPRTLQRRLAGARSIEVPPQLRLPSSSKSSPGSGTGPMDLPLASPPPAPASGTGGEIPAQRVRDEDAGTAQESAPIVSEQRPLPAQPAGASAARSEAATPSTPLPLHTASRPTDAGVESGISAQRSDESERSSISGQSTEDSEHDGISAQRAQGGAEHRTEDAEQSGISAQRQDAPLAGEQDPITAQRTADTTTVTGAAQSTPESTALPLHTATTRSSEDGSGTAGEHPWSISAPRPEEVAPLAGEQDPITAQRTADTAPAAGATARPAASSAELPLHSATRLPEAGVGSASEPPASEGSNVSAPPVDVTAQRVEDTAGVGSTSEDPPTDASSISAQRARDTDTDRATDTEPDTDPATTTPTTPTISPLSTTASPEPLTDAGSTTREQVGASAGSLPLAPHDWQETLQVPSERGTAAQGEGPPAPMLQLQRRAAPPGTAAPSEGPPLLPLSASRAVGAQKPLSSLAPLIPTTTSPVQRSVSAAATPAAATTLIRPRASGSGAPAQAAVGRRSPPDLPEVITSGTLAASPPPGTAAVVDSQEARPTAPAGSATDLPLQRNSSGTGATTMTAAPPALPLHTPAAAIPSAADLAVKAGLAERGPDGSLHYTQPPAGTQVQREFVVQREGETAISAPPTPTDTGNTAGGSQIMSVSPTGGAPDVTLQEKAQTLAEQARKLYPHIRNQLESDIRQQLEARSRASGSR